MDVSQPPSMSRGAVYCVYGLCHSARRPWLVSGATNSGAPTNPAMYVGDWLNYSACMRHSLIPRKTESQGNTLLASPLHCTLFLFSDERRKGTDSTFRYIIYSPHGTSASAAPSVCSRHLNPTNRFSPLNHPSEGVDLRGVEMQAALMMKSLPSRVAHVGLEFKKISD